MNYNLLEIRDGPVIAAIIAALGFVAKMLIDSAAAYLRTRRRRTARLVDLESLLRANYVSFQVQQRNVFRLLTMVGQRDRSIFDGPPGYENMLVRAYPLLMPGEEELRQVIRGITMHSMQPTNQALVNWLRVDSYFRTYLGTRSKYAKLAEQLAQMEPHLLLWLAKYDAWMPDPKHNVIYLADEEKHGLGFPRDVDRTVDELLRGPRPADTDVDDSNPRAQRMRTEKLLSSELAKARADFRDFRKQSAG